MPDEPHPCERAGVAMQTGRIPSRQPDRTWGGPGVGAACTVCDLPIGKDQLEFERHAVRDAPPPP